MVISFPPFGNQQVEKQPVEVGPDSGDVGEVVNQRSVIAGFVPSRGKIHSGGVVEGIDEEKVDRPPRPYPNPLSSPSM